MYAKILVYMLKNGLTHHTMIKEEGKHRYLQKKNKKFIGLKIYNYKIAATATKSYFYCVQKVPHKIND